jgi:hypothetical protein
MSERTYADLEIPEPTKAEIVPLAEPQERQRGTLTPMDLLRMAVSQNADIEKITKFVEWYENREAQKAFAVAMKQFKATPPMIVKNKQVRYATKAGGMVDYRHATLDNACNQIVPALSAVGITHAWKVVQDKDLITVICILTGFGHSEETQMQGVPDTSGDKSPLKAFSSTVTHLQRYTLLSACGLAASEDDETENHGSSQPFIEGKEIEKNCGEMSRAKDSSELKFLFSVAYSKAQELGDRKAMSYYITAKDARKKEFEHGAH